MKGLPPWRIAAGIAVLLGLLAIAIALSPIYIHNLQLQSFVADLTQTASREAASDDAVRSGILAKARSLNLPVMADDVQITHAAGRLRVDIRYFVTVNLPGYTVGLHFHPTAGSR